MAETTKTKLMKTESSGECTEVEKKEACEEEKLISPKGDFHEEEVLQSPPKVKGWEIVQLCFLQNFWCNQFIVQSTLSFQKYFQAKDNDIVIASLLKSGTTWLKAIVFAIVKRKRFIPSQNDHPLRNFNSHTLVPFFEFDIYADNANNIDLSTLPEPRMFGTHIPFPSLSHSIHNSKCKIIYICRNPFDTFISYWHFMNKIRSSHLLPTLTLEEAFEMYSEGKHSLGPFWSHILGYWKASKDTPNKVLFLKYEDLKANPNFELKRIAQFLDCPFTIEEESGGIIDSIIELCSFKTMKELEVNKSEKIHLKIEIEHKNLFRKGIIGDWVNYFSPWMIEKFSKIIEEKFAGSGLSF